MSNIVEHMHNIISSRKKREDQSTWDIICVGVEEIHVFTMYRRMGLITQFNDCVVGVATCVHVAVRPNCNLTIVMVDPVLYNSVHSQGFIWAKIFEGETERRVGQMGCLAFLAGQGCGCRRGMCPLPCEAWKA